MPVQRRPQRSPLLRVRTPAVLLGAAMSLLTIACDHDQADTKAPSAEEESPELAALRRDNAALRSRVQNLEERLRAAAGGGSGSAEYASGDGYQRYGSAADDGEPSWDEPELDGPRQLPVVKLTPETRAVERRTKPKPAAPAPVAAVRRSGSISLSPASPTGSADDDYDDDDYAYDSRDSDNFDEFVDPSAEPASYRLVGSKLVQATKRKAAANVSASISASPSKKSGRDSAVLASYKAAMSLYQAGRYADAEAAFAAIVSAHPNHDYADNALYWQGEAAYDQAHYADALAAFTKVIERYGGGAKAPDALLKIGLCYGRLGDAANARDVLTQLVAAYPAANASKIAKRKLADLDH
jgi:tol-pal system protein YbgF